jgi:hypothetical protein
MLIESRELDCLVLSTRANVSANRATGILSNCMRKENMMQILKQNISNFLDTSQVNLLVGDPLGG